MTRPLIIVVAVARNGVIGRDNRLLWRLKTDLRRYRDLTWGKPMIMGRRTFESIGRPLPRRTNIVVSRTPGWSADGVIAVSSVDEALDAAEECDGDAMVIGGAQIYAATLPLADVQVLTEVHLEPVGDVHYPEFDRSEWVETRREKGEGCDFVWLERTT